MDLLLKVFHLMKNIDKDEKNDKKEKNKPKLKLNF